MSDGINIEQRSIVLMPFPYSDLSGSKKRPALVVSSTEFNKSNEDIICCLITSNLEDKQHSITISNKDVESGFLEFESKILSPHPFRMGPNVFIDHFMEPPRIPLNASGLYRLGLELAK